MLFAIKDITGDNLFFNRTAHWCTTLCLKKSSHLLTVCNLTVFKIFVLLESIRNLLQNPYDITHLTLGMLLHYLGKLKSQIFCRFVRKCKQFAF